MRAEEILQEPRHIEWLIKTISAEIELARCSLLPGGINYELDKIQGGAGGDRYADVMAKIDALEQKAKRLEEKRARLLDEVIPRLVALCDDETARILILHDVKGIPMEELSLKHYRSRSNLYELRRVGLVVIQTTLDGLNGECVIQINS